MPKNRVLLCMAVGGLKLAPKTVSINLSMNLDWFNYSPLSLTQVDQVSSVNKDTEDCFLIIST